MTIPIPLALRLVTDRADRDVTISLRSLSFRSTAVGGFAHIRASLDRPLSFRPDEIAYYGRAYVYDTRSGATICEGRLEDPARSAGRDGQVWDIKAVGPVAHTRDRRVPLIYVDTSLRDLVRVDNATPGANAYVGNDPGDATGLNETLVLQFPQGLGLATNSRVVMRYNRLSEAGQKLARLDYTWDAGRTSASLAVEALARTDGNLATGETARTDTFNTAGGAASPREIVTNWTSGRNTAELRIIWTGGASTVADDLTWASIRNLAIVATRYSAAGSELLTAADYSANTVLASEVVADLLGRLLPKFDGANAIISATSYAIDKLAWPDGVTAGDVLDDLLILHPDYRWGAWESNAAGLYRFEFSPWPTTVRYEADVTDGYRSSGSAAQLYNSVTVRWRDAQGQIRSTIRTATVADLTAAGLTRSTIIDLGDEVGSLANAQQAGDRFLAEHSSALNAGTLTVARRIMDLQRSHYVDPWEIIPGNLIRVRGIEPRIDALNATTRDAVSVFKITAVDYSTENAAATLELDSPPRTLPQMVAEQSRRPNTRRR